MENKVKKGAELHDQIARLMIENEREQRYKLEQHFASMTALIVLSIAMAQGAQMLVKDACDMHNIVQNNMTRSIRQKEKAAFNSVIKQLMLAKSSLETFQDLQDIFTGSGAINTDEQMRIGEDFIKKMHEVAELCCLYENAQNSNPDIMKLLRPIFIGQTKKNDQAITAKTIEHVRIKERPVEDSQQPAS